MPSARFPPEPARVPRRAYTGRVVTSALGRPATDATEPAELTLHDAVAGAVAAYCPQLSAAMRLRSRASGGEADVCQRGRSRSQRSAW